MTTTSGGRPSGASSGPVKSAAPQTPAQESPTPIRAASAQQAPLGAGAVVTPAGTPVVLRPSRRRIVVMRVDPWTVLRLSFLLSVAAAVVTVVAVLVLWSMMAAAGVFSSVDATLESVLGDGAPTITQYFSFGRVFSMALLIGAIDVVLITALATVGAFLFNLATSLVGGLELSVSDEE